MTKLFSQRLSARALGPIAASALLAIAQFAGAAPALAQSDSYPSSDEDIVVMGRYGRVPDDAQSLSQRVSYADLDLSTDYGQRALRHRISLTARYLCDKLGESDNDSLAPSCRDAAVRDALDRVGTIEAHFAPRGTTWAAPARWEPPYPESWDTTYP